MTRVIFAINQIQISRWTTTFLRENISFVFNRSSVISIRWVWRENDSGQVGLNFKACLRTRPVRGCMISFMKDPATWAPSPVLFFRGTNPCLNCIKSLQNCCLYFQAQEEVELGNSKPNYGLVICYGVNFICWLFVMGATSYLIVLFFYTFGINIIFVLSAFILHIIFMILFITIFTAQVSFSIHHVKIRH